jgi:hypothetical protein
LLYKRQKQRLVVLASFISLTVNQVDIVDTVNGVDGVDRVNSPTLAGGTHLATTKLLILTPLRIISLTARFKANNIQAIARHSKTQ